MVILKILTSFAVQGKMYRILLEHLLLFIFLLISIFKIIICAKHTHKSETGAFKVKYINMYYETNANKITVFTFLFHLFVEMLFGLHCSLKFEEYAIKKMKTLFYSVLHLIPIQHVIYFVYTNLRRTHMYELVMPVNYKTY